jgi:hypothetical protein
MSKFNKEPFGQNEKRYVRIRNIIKLYPESTLLKEMIQNADDAG